jgi:hypothetical protein
MIPAEDLICKDTVQTDRAGVSVTVGFQYVRASTGEIVHSAKGFVSEQYLRDAKATALRSLTGQKPRLPRPDMVSIGALRKALMRCQPSRAAA